MPDPVQPEVWLRGPLPDYPDELQPVAHSLLQVREEIAAVAVLAPEHLWARPGGAASIGFHLRHLAGSLDRLLTYARGGRLNAAQRQALVGLRNSRQISSDVMRRVEHELDLEESRLEV